MIMLLMLQINIYLHLKQKGRRKTDSEIIRETHHHTKITSFFIQLQADRQKYCKDRKSLHYEWFESDFKMKMTSVITGGLQLSYPCNLLPT